MLLDRSGETGWNIKCTLVMSGGQPKGVCVCVCMRVCVRVCVYTWCYLCL